MPEGGCEDVALGLALEHIALLGPLVPPGELAVIAEGAVPSTSINRLRAAAGRHGATCCHGAESARRAASVVVSAGCTPRASQRGPSRDFCVAAQPVAEVRRHRLLCLILALVLLYCALSVLLKRV
jgi:hypothetical protein